MAWLESTTVSWSVIFSQRLLPAAKGEGDIGSPAPVEMTHTLWGGGRDVFDVDQAVVGDA
jgi:hypothetical protein